MPGKYAILILAAGASKRMGKPKQGLLFRGKPLVRIAALSALEATENVVIVTGAAEEITSEAVKGLPVKLVFNPEWESGMASSLRKGIQHFIAAEPEIASVVVITCDQPLLTGDHLRALISEKETSGAGIVASGYSGTMGTPAVFDREFFPDLLQLSGDKGARSLFYEYAGRTGMVDFPEGATDLDTETDYEQLLKKEDDQRQV